ncbi:unnamed protein product [Mycena citricolor]|uniref:Beta-lactamase-related domain-containing protein n=1 Tax=Mycena citricolor TaxID=2018698 RepID=A0AAD2H4C2_9AGAR|nr:unnamed protein product [Mycena citricolor]CAK5284238.1 unnamed protein product [Mycena citricolor]
MVAFSASQRQRIDELLRDSVDSKTTSALFYGVTDVNGPIYMNHVGHKLIDDPASDRINEDTVFWLCSQSKLVTSIATLQLIDQGKITRDTLAETILPELANLLVGSLPGIPLRFDPGTDFAYGFSSDIAGFIVERVSGKTLEQYFKDHIFNPLGIASTTFYPTDQIKQALLPLSYRTKKGEIERWNAPPVVDMDPANVKVFLGGVGLYSTQKDYLAILRHLLQIKAGVASEPILTLSTVESLFQPTLCTKAADTINIQMPIFSRYLNAPVGCGQWSTGLLVNLEDVPGKRRKGSGAWGGWASTTYFMDPASGIAVLMGAQLVPSGDDEYEKLFGILESEVYKAIS